jgi:hypothetical protein
MFRLLDKQSSTVLIFALLHVKKFSVPRDNVGKKLTSK